MCYHATPVDDLTSDWHDWHNGYQDLMNAICIQNGMSLFPIFDNLYHEIDSLVHPLMIDIFKRFTHYGTGSKYKK